MPSGQAPIVLPKSVQVGGLAKLLELSVVDVIRALVNMGVMATINQTIDYETAALVANELGIEVTPEEEQIALPAESAEEAVPGKEILWTDEVPLMRRLLGAREDRLR
ncbi:MAG: translation initiation factor IF-2 N-terminal domain-containing protein, partial [Chloroflexota bacterium]